MEDAGGCLAIVGFIVAAIVVLIFFPVIAVFGVCVLSLIYIVPTVIDMFKNPWGY